MAQRHVRAVGAHVLVIAVAEQHPEQQQPHAGPAAQAREEAGRGRDAQRDAHVREQAAQVARTQSHRVLDE